MASSPGSTEAQYDIVLVSAGPRPRRVARTVADFTDRWRSEALELVQTAPVLVLQDVGYATAEGGPAGVRALWREG
jgi:hypothetical protein